MREVIEEKLMSINDISPHIFEIMHHLFASVCYHYDYLDKKIAEGSKL